MWTHHDFFLQWQKVSKIVVKSKCYVNKIVEVYNLIIATGFFPLSIIYNLHWSGADGTKDTESFYDLWILSRVYGIKKSANFLPPRCKKGLTHLQYLNLGAWLPATHYYADPSSHILARCTEISFLVRRHRHSCAPRICFFLGLAREHPAEECTSMITFSSIISTYHQRERTNEWITSTWVRVVYCPRETNGWLLSMRNVLSSIIRSIPR